MHEFYAVAAYSTGSPADADALADRLIAAGCDDLYSHHPDNAVQVSYGPFISTAKNGNELRGDARYALVRLAGPRAGVPEVLNVSNSDSGAVHEFAHL